MMSLRGSVCLYQGEELGLTEADIAYDQLQDPYGKRMWPEFKGRDGCRTPMVWESSQPNGGFSSAKPWLPVPNDHLSKAVSVQRDDEKSLLEHYRRFLAFRRANPALAKGDIDFWTAEDDVVIFSRDLGNEQIVCAFNLGPRRISVDLGGETQLETVGGHGFDGAAVDGKINLGSYGAWFGRQA
jgi:alpha-glucosidase